MSHWPGLLKLAADRSDDNLEDCRNLPTERATRHRYSSQDNEWVTDTVEVRLPGIKIGEGGCREVHLMYTKTKVGTWAKMVVKVDLDYTAYTAAENLERAKDGSKMQAIVANVGRRFNRQDPPVKIDVVESFAIEVPVSEHRMEVYVGSFEAFIPGDFVKHNDPNGYLVGMEQGFTNRGHRMRQTPQAFSHFSWHDSEGEMFVADVQGVQGGRDAAFLLCIRTVY